MGNTPPTFGVGGWGVRCGGQSAVKVTEKENWEEKKTWSHWYSGGSTLDAFPVESETRPLDQKYLRKASTCLQTDNFTLIYKHGVPASGGKQKKKGTAFGTAVLPGQYRHQVANLRNLRSEVGKLELQAPQVPLHRTCRNCHVYPNTYPSACNYLYL
jgi:hypothetical protein